LVIDAGVRNHRAAGVSGEAEDRGIGEVGNRYFVGQGGEIGGRRESRNRGPRVQERDLAIVEWIDRHGLATPQQVSRRFFGSMPAAWRRIGAMVKMGLIVRRRISWMEPQLLLATRFGRQQVGLRLRPVRVTPARLNHSLGVVDLSLTFEEMAKAGALFAGEALTGAGWVTERELLVERGRRIQAGEVRRAEGRCPDGVLRVGDGRRVAIELELTPKRGGDYKAIAIAYLRELRWVDRVWWFVRGRSLAAMIQRSIDRMGLDDVVSVHGWIGDEARVVEAPWNHPFEIRRLGAR
jgi:hypothetical protein